LLVNEKKNLFKYFKFLRGFDYNGSVCVRDGQFVLIGNNIDYIKRVQKRKSFIIVWDFFFVIYVQNISYIVLLIFVYIYLIKIITVISINWGLSLTLLFKIIDFW